MPEPSPPTRTAPHRLDLVAGAAIATCLALQARFAWLDERPPTDLGHYYDTFQHLVRQWDTTGALTVERLDSPYSLLLVLLARPFGPSVGLMELVSAAGLLVLLLGVWALARGVAGPLAGAVATVAVAGFPQTSVFARTHWIHHPETAALVGALGLWALAPGLPSWAGAMAVGGLLFFGETIRQTGIPFGMPVALVILVGGWAAGARARLLPVALAFVGGVAWYAPVLATYVSNKAASAAGYAQSVQDPWRFFMEGMGTPLFVAIALLAVPALAALRKRDRTAAIVALCLLWLGGAALAVGVFHVGADNFPVAGVALAVLAGIGASRLATLGVGRWRGAGAAAALVVVASASALLQGSALLSSEAVRPIQDLIAPWATSGPLNYFRVEWNPLTTAVVAPLVDQACALERPGDAEAAAAARCDIVASRGLFNNGWEDGGSFALFLAGQRTVRVSTPALVWDGEGRPVSGRRLVRALVDVSCPRRLAPEQGGRFDTQNARLASLIQEHGADGPDVTIHDPGGCEQRWYFLGAGIRLDPPAR